MNQSEFNRALQKYENRRRKQAGAALAEADKPKAISAALPFVESKPEPKKEKPVEAVRPKLPVMKVTIEGPVNFQMTIDYQGTLLGGQLTEQTLRPMVRKALSILGRVN